MAKKTGSNGGGASIMLSPEEHTARRHAAQARRRTNREKGRFATPGSATLMDEIRQDREERRQARLAREEATKAAFEAQADKAMALLPTDLNGLARYVASAMITAFRIPQSGNPLQAAEVKMLTTLTEDQLKRPGAVQLGIKQARSALIKARYAVQPSGTSTSA